MKLKRIILLHRKAGLTRDAMLAYWRDVHAPLAMRYPEWFESTARYTQNHLGDRLDDPRAGEPFEFDGMVESWQRPEGAVGRSFPDTAAYRDVVGPDELNFVDRANSILFFVNEHVLAPRAGAVKVLRFVARAPAVDAAAFAARWTAMAGTVVQPAGGLVRNVTVPGSMKVIGAPAMPPPIDVAGIEERWFATADDAGAAFVAGAAPLPGDELARTLAVVLSREFNLYDRQSLSPRR